MKALAPLLLLAAALAVFALTPPQQPLLGLSHDDFARGAMGAAFLLWLVLNGAAWAGRAGASRVFAAAAFWAMAFAVVALAYNNRFAFSEIADRVVSGFNPEPEEGPSGQVVIRRGYGGGFMVPARVNGQKVRFVFDTGASSVVLSAEDAARVGLVFHRDDYTVDVTTANGSATAAPTRLDRLAVGGLVVRDVRALVAKPGTLSESLLGMSFLDRLKGFGVEEGKLVLKGR